MKTIAKINQSNANTATSESIHVLLLIRTTYAVLHLLWISSMQNTAPWFFPIVFKHHASVVGFFPVSSKRKIVHRGRQGRDETNAIDSLDRMHPEAGTTDFFVSWWHFVFVFDAARYCVLSVVLDFLAQNAVCVLLDGGSSSSIVQEIPALCCVVGDCRKP